MNQTSHVFWSAWEKHFKSVLNEAIASEIGYGLDRFRHSASPSTLVQQKIETMIARKESLTKFMNGFVANCRRNGFLSQDGTPIVVIDSGLDGQIPYACLDFMKLLMKNYTGLENQIDKVHKKFGNRRRPRIPNEVAFQILCLLESCNGDRNEANHLKEIVKINGHLDQLIDEITKSHIDKVIRSLKRELARNELKLKQKRLPGRSRREIKSLMAARQRKIDRIKAFKIKWNPFNVSRDLNDANWVNKFKNNLIRSILSEGQPRIIRSLKRLNPKLLREKKRLLDEVKLGKRTDIHRARILKAQMAKLTAMFKEIEGS